VPKDYRALIERGLQDNPSYTVEDVMDGLRSGYFQCFEEDKGIAITKFAGFRDKRLLVFLLVGEDLDDWKNSMDGKLERFAKENGCSCIEAYCRPGLQKSLKSLGWKTEQLVLRRKIKNGE
jgi:hypothetical protein